MARMTSDLTELRQQENLPKGIYTAHIDSATDMKGKNPPYNPYIQLTHMIEGDENGLPTEAAGRKIPFDNVNIGGISKEGKPITAFRLAKVLEVYEVPHTCLECHPDAAAEARAGTYDGRYDRACHFLRGDGTNGIPKGQIVCPDCQQPMNVNYDSNSFVGRRARVAVDIEPDLKGVPRNVVKDYISAGS